MFLALTALLAATGAAVPTVPVTLSSYAYAPAPIRLTAGQEVQLVLTNRAGKGHDFAAPEFFAAARVSPQSARLVRAGRVEVPAGETVIVQLTPARGRYALRCTHFGHAMLGMKGSIVVQ